MDLEQAKKAATELIDEFEQAKSSEDGAAAKERSAKQKAEKAEKQKLHASADLSLQTSVVAESKAEVQENAELAKKSVDAVNIANDEARQAILNAEEIILKVKEKVVEAEALFAKAKKSTETARLATQTANKLNERVTVARAAADAAADEYQQMKSAWLATKGTRESLEAKISSIVGILSGKNISSNRWIYLIVSPSS